MKFATRALHVGQEPDAASGAVIPPITLSSTFAQNSPGNPLGSFDYSRSGNPNRESLEKCIASLEEARHGIAFSSGLSATVAMLHVLQAGDHVVCVNDVYGGTQRYFRQVATKFGVCFSFVDFSDHEELRNVIITRESKMLWLEVSQSSCGVVPGVLVDLVVMPD